MKKELNQGMMVYLSQSPGLETKTSETYNAMIALQKSFGCVFKKMPENDVEFDRYVGQTYIKAMTHKEDGRTMVILGKDHHGSAGQGYFEMDPDPYTNKSGKGFGNMIRWGFLGDTFENGVLLVDFSIDGMPLSGMATNIVEVQTILSWLSKYNFSCKKQVYLTRSDKIYQPEIGKTSRQNGILTIEDWLNYNSFAEPDKKKKKTARKKSKLSTHLSLPQWILPGGSLRTSSLW